MSNAVSEIGELNLKGNVVDHEWFNYLTFSNGKPHIVAIMVLSEVVYWYRPTVIRDETSSKITYKKKFKSDKLQKNYDQLAETFGFTKLQVKRACDFLTDMKLIKVEFRTIKIDGKTLNNVMFVEPIASEIKKISSMYQSEQEDPVDSEVKRVPTSKSTPSLLESKDPSYLEVKTNTETTTENTTDIVVSSSNALSFYEHNFGFLNPYMADSIIKWVEDTNEELVMAAMEIALKQQKKWNYAEGILKQWVTANIKTLNDVKAAQEEFKKNKKRKGKVKDGVSNGRAKANGDFLTKYDFS
ncbi:DnaD replication protein [Bacillus manliponensis]|uniref:DnaD replication protein n=1 Tax=Bacillus manliponensis TaxID=574376 RepID=A0A073JST8_9BACI|nr:DnaD domain protein [Bacillus manliponensis]KEK17370.1 DnaD replication protein [Bacillus manliponensis]